MASGYQLEIIRWRQNDKGTEIRPHQAATAIGDVFHASIPDSAASSSVLQGSRFLCDKMNQTAYL